MHFSLDVFNSVYHHEGGSHILDDQLLSRIIWRRRNFPAGSCCRKIHAPCKFSPAYCSSTSFTPEASPTPEGHRFRISWNWVTQGHSHPYSLILRKISPWGLMIELETFIQQFWIMPPWILWVCWTKWRRYRWYRNSFRSWIYGTLPQGEGQNKCHVPSLLWIGSKFPKKVQYL